MVFNKYQTPLEELNVEKEVLADITDYLNSVKFLERLISPDRSRAKDLDRDNFGRIKVDIANPHILEDMDYFRQPAIHFQKHGTYTFLYPSSHPSSEYVKFWKEETRRCREGMVRQSDGEWITGLHYFYLNYSPILLTLEKEGQKAQRVTNLPSFFDSDYLFYHYLEQGMLEGQHAAVLKCRGMGYSFKGGSSLAKIFILGDREESRNKQNAFAIANEKEYLNVDGILNKFEDVIAHCASHTPFPRNKLKDSMHDMEWVMGYIDSETGRDAGTLNRVAGVTLKNDPQRARGKRGPYVLFEEAGKFRDFLTAWNIARPSVEDGGVAFGQLIGWGTGGVAGADFHGIEEMFYNPEGYNVYTLANVFDRNTGDTAKCAFFAPAYMNRLGNYDKDGNSNVTKALAEIISNRYKIRHNSSDPNTVTQNKAEIPIVPQDSVLRVEGSVFPVGDLKDFIMEIKTDVYKFTASHYVGRLTYDSSGNIHWAPDTSLKPIRSYPLKDNVNKSGAVEIFQQPIKNSQGEVPRMRYISGIDGYDDDFSTTNSLGSIFIFDRWTDRIVAEYTGRPNTANEFYEICLRLLKYYNATCNYENDKKGLFTYFANHHGLQYLCDTPQILKDMEMIKPITGFSNKSKGTNSGGEINKLGRRLQADWMREVAYGQSSVTIDDNGNEIEEIPQLNLHKIRSIGYLEEAVGWNIDGNFDRVSAMGMLMILREDLARYEVKREDSRVKDLAQDDFFKRTYKQVKRNRSYNFK